MKEVIIKCDQCFKTPAKSYRVKKDKTMDASGNGYEDVCIFPELCLSCLIDFARKHPEYEITENY